MADIVESGKTRVSDGLKKARSLSRGLPLISRTKSASSTVTLRFCYHCGAVLSDDFEPDTRCNACNEIIHEPSTTPPGFQSNDNSVNRISDTAKLDAETIRWVDDGYRVVRQKRDFVELRKPKRFSDKWAMAWLIAGIPFPGAAIAYAGGYAVWHVVKKERSILLFLDSDGTVRTEKQKT